MYFKNLLAFNFLIKMIFANLLFVFYTVRYFWWMYGEGMSVNKQDFQVDYTLWLDVSFRLNQRSGERWRNWERKIQGMIVWIGLI